MGKVCPDFMCHSNICSVITYRMYNHSSLLHEFSWHRSLTQSSAARESWGKACSKLVLRLRQQMNGSVPSSKSLMPACRRVLLACPGSAGHSRADSLEHCPMCCDWHEPPLRRSSSSRCSRPPHRAPSLGTTWEKEEESTASSILGTAAPPYSLILTVSSQPGFICPPGTWFSMPSINGTVMGHSSFLKGQHMTLLTAVPLWRATMSTVS